MAQNNSVKEFDGEKDSERWEYVKKLAETLQFAEIQLSIHKGKLRSVKFISGEKRFKDE